MKAYEELEVELRLFLTLALGWSVWPSPYTGGFYPLEKWPHNPFIMRLDGLDSPSVSFAEENLLPLPGIEYDHSVFYHEIMLCTSWGIPIPTDTFYILKLSVFNKNQN